MSSKVTREQARVARAIERRKQQAAAWKRSQAKAKDLDLFSIIDAALLLDRAGFVIWYHVRDLTEGVHRILGQIFITRSALRNVVQHLRLKPNETRDRHLAAVNAAPPSTDLTVSA